MSASPFDETLHGSEQEICAALIERCNLSADAVDSIMRARKELRIGILEAAIQIGLVTPEEAADAIEDLRQRGSRRPMGVIETALRRQAGTRIVAVQHAQMVKPGRDLILAHDLDNDRSERIRALRTELLLLLGTADVANVISVMSPQSGEGRTQLSAELAIAFSQLGRRTLLVDGDLRRPAQHFLFNAPNQYGLAQALAAEERPAVFGVEGLPHLSLVTAGAITPNPLELLSGGRGERLIAQWKYDQEFVIIDTPPVSQYADALTIAMIAGRVLVLSRAQSTRHNEMKNMLRRLASTQSQILGAVINNF
jgi:protein-tyrosine kinase